MTRIYSTIQIPIPVETVYNYVTAPANWPQWHPSSLAVSGDADHSLHVGEQVEEEFLVAGRHGKVRWTVRERTFPRHWSIEGTIAGSGNGGTVTYTLSPHDGGTWFEREFTYHVPNFLLALLDWLVIRRRIQAESTQAVQQLRTILTRQSAPT